MVVKQFHKRCKVDSKQFVSLSPKVSNTANMVVPRQKICVLNRSTLKSSKVLTFKLLEKCVMKLVDIH